jgi:hypothetical protein
VSGRVKFATNGPGRHGLDARPHPEPLTSPEHAQQGANLYPQTPVLQPREFDMDARLASLSDRIVILERQLDALSAENARLRGVDAETGQARHLVERRAAAS